MSAYREWIPLAAVAAHLRVSRQAVHKRIKEGRLTAWRVKPHKTVVLVEDVERWAQERRSRVRFDCPAVFA